MYTLQQRGDAFGSPPACFAPDHSKRKLGPLPNVTQSALQAAACGRTCTMPSPNSYIALSLPLRTFDTGDKEEAIQSLSATVGSENGTVTGFPIPSFKIGTLDALVQQADELTKLHAGCEGVVQRVSDSLKTILDGDEEKIAQNKMVNDSEHAVARGHVERAGG